MTLHDQLQACKRHIEHIPRNTHDGEDLFQDVYVACTQKNTQYDWGAPQRGRIHFIARNLCVRHLRRAKVRKHDLLIPETHVDKCVWPDIAAEQAEANRMIKAALESLAPVYREVLYRRFYLNESLGDIARCDGIPEQTVRTRYKRAIRHLKSNPRLSSLA